MEGENQRWCEGEEERRRATGDSGGNCGPPQTLLHTH